MAAEDRRRDRSVGERLFAEPQTFDFFQAVSLLGKLRAQDGPEAPVRFRTPLSLAFPPSAVAALEAPGEGGAGPPEMTIAFLGLTGPSGALPRHYTEAPIERRIVHRDTTAHAFFDLFTHRAAAAFYDAWRKHRFTLRYEEGDRGALLQYALDLCGLGLAALRRRLATEAGAPEEALAFYSGLLARHPRSAAAVEALIADHFGVPVRVEPLRGRWLRMDEGGLTRLGRRGRGANRRLGEDAVLGSRAWDRAGALRLRIGPLSRERYEALLPGGGAHGPLLRLARLMLGPALDFDVRLILRRKDVPRLRLRARRREDAPEGAPRLGWSAWLLAAPAGRDGEAVFPVSA